MPVESLRDARDRGRAAAIVVTIHLGLGYALVSGLGVGLDSAPEERTALPLILVEPEPPEPSIPMIPEKVRRATKRPKDPEGAAALPALKNTPTPVVAPDPIISLPAATPLPAAPIAGQGTAPLAGAAPIPGPGTGRGGTGVGLGAGQFGDGTGGGGGGGAASPPRYLRGNIGWRDVPSSLLARRPRGTVLFRLLIDRHGKPVSCVVTGSSGDGGLDRSTCAAAVRRLRYAPARDRSGRAAQAWTEGRNEWIPNAPPPDQWYEADLIKD